MIDWKLAKKLKDVGFPNDFVMTPKQFNNFWKKVNKTDNCWIWIGAKMGFKTHLYGNFGFNHKSNYAHRLSWELYNGPIPKGLWVLHKCDNPACVNPKHLFLGTAKTNALDRDLKGRTSKHIGKLIKDGKIILPKGEEHYKSKLNNEDIKLIRKLKKRGLNSFKIAQKFFMSSSHIRNILAKRYWKHI